MTLDELTRVALALSDDDRAELAEKMFESLPDDPDAFGPDTPGYEEEIQRRIEDIRSGRVKTIPAAEVMRRMEEDDLDDPS